MTGATGGELERGVRILIDGDLARLPLLLEHVRRLAASVLDESRAEDVALTVDELVVNAIQHVGGELVIDLALIEGALRVGVRDDDPDFRRLPEGVRSGRYGLRIVDSVSDRWSMAPLDGPAVGKVVWADFDLPHPNETDVGPGSLGSPPP